MKWVLIVMTWFGSVDKMEQTLPTKGERDCDRMERVITGGWKENHVEGFVGVTMCRERKYVVES